MLVVVLNPFFFYIEDCSLVTFEWKEGQTKSRLKFGFFFLLEFFACFVMSVIGPTVGVDNIQMLRAPSFLSFENFCKRMY